MMKVLTAALVLALPAAAGAQQPDTGTFSVLQGDAAIATETFSRTADRLETTLEITNQATLVTRSDLAADATIRRMEIEVYGPGGEGEPIETSAATFAGEGVTLEQPIGTVVTEEPQPAEQGSIPYVNPSPSYMEQILRRARAIGGDEVRVGIWMPGQPIAETSVVAFDDGAATINLAGIVIEATTDAEGRLLGATIPAQGVTIIRE
ncbi:MAG TPA: hypothetical protein VK966_12750 [Longimicrobiales bacterium]|nr:hypothetical protein [Longimicrobiales bacterium]